MLALRHVSGREGKRAEPQLGPAAHAPPQTPPRVGHTLLISLTQPSGYSLEVNAEDKMFKLTGKLHKANNPIPTLTGLLPKMEWSRVLLPEAHHLTRPSLSASRRHAECSMAQVPLVWTERLLSALGLRGPADLCPPSDSIAGRGCCLCPNRPRRLKGFSRRTQRKAGRLPP